jgi:hypothetical protein
VQIPGRHRPPLGHHLFQARPVDVLDRQVRDLVIRVGVHHRRGAERRHLPDPLHLAAEPGPELLAAGELGPDRLDRHRAPGAIAAQIDHAHPALTEPGQQVEIAEPPGVLGLQRFTTHQ